MLHMDPEQVIPELVRVPGWERFRWLRAGFSTRRGGFSAAYGPGELNLGWTREDDAATVAANRDTFVREVAAGAPMSLVTVGQVHSATVRDLAQEPQPWMREDARARMEGDGLIGRKPGALLAILTADCVPVLLVDTHSRAVGAFHAGWRGTLARIVELGVERMRQSYGSLPEHLIAAIGPCIGSCCFEVGTEVKEAFTAEFPDAGSLFAAEYNDKYRLDLVEANRRQLIGSGLAERAIWAAAECTACARESPDRRRYFSYRAERGVTGRMLSGVGIIA
jgi:polyphenol oxidase